MLSIDFDEDEGLYRALDKPEELEENKGRDTSHLKIEYIDINHYFFDINIKNIL